jgi:glycosyltransferase domain-containing protein
MNINEQIEWLTQEINKKNDAGIFPAYENLSKITVVVPTYNRQKYILRQAVYWYKSGATVLILDGSAVGLGAEIVKIFRAIPNFYYYHLNISIHERLHFAGKHLSTPYAVMLSDDEFLLKCTLNNIIDKLDKGAGVVACNGQVIGFSTSKYREMVYYDAGYSFWNYSILDDSVYARLQKAMLNYNAATCAAVLRSDVWVNSWGSVSLLMPPTVGELEQAIITYVAGKLLTVNELYWLRSSENELITISNSFDRKTSFKDWWESDQSSKDAAYERLATISKHYMNNSDLEIKKIIEGAFVSYNSFIGKGKITSRVVFPLKVFKMLIRVFLLKVLGEKIYNMLKLQRRKWLFKKKVLSSEIVFDWQMFGKSNNEIVVNQELQEINRLLASFYNN